MMRFLVMTALMLCTGIASAQDAQAPEKQADPAGPSQPNAPQAVVDMSQVAVGDHWSYDVIDDITGQVKQRGTALVTDVSDKDITCRNGIEGSARYGIYIYDKSWNIIKQGDQRFSPNDGGGIRAPLEVNKFWSLEANRIDPNGQVWKKPDSSM